MYYIYQNILIICNSFTRLPEYGGNQKTSQSEMLSACESLCMFECADSWLLLKYPQQQTNTSAHYIWQEYVRMFFCVIYLWSSTEKRHHVRQKCSPSLCFVSTVWKGHYHKQEVRRAVSMHNSASLRQRVHKSLWRAWKGTCIPV